jgi:hypothetical protein
MKYEQLKAEYSDLWLRCVVKDDKKSEKISVNYNNSSNNNYNNSNINNKEKVE